MTQRTTMLILLSAMLALGACTSEKIQVLKSPCVGLEGSPCGPKRPVNGKLNQWHPETAEHV